MTMDQLQVTPGTIYDDIISSAGPAVERGISLDASLGNGFKFNSVESGKHLLMFKQKVDYLFILIEFILIKGMS